MNRVLKVLMVSLLISVLFLIRGFEDSLFIDPFIVFFKQEFINKPAPDFNVTVSVAQTTLRYFINSAVSIMILLILYRPQIFKFLLLFYAVAYLILILLFVMFLYQLNQDNQLYFFYVRRFLTQPLLLLLLTPAFYYQEILRKH